MSTEPAAIAAAARAADVRQRTRAAMVRFFNHNAAYARRAGIVIAALVVGISHDRVRPGVLGAWLLLVVAMVATRSRWLRQYTARDEAQALAEAEHWRARAIAGSLFTGVAWAAAVLMLFDRDDVIVQMLATMFTTIVSIGSVSVLAAIPAAYACQTGPMLLALAGSFAALGTPAGWAFAAAVAAGAVVLAGFARNHGNLVASTYALRFEREHLLDDLSARTREAEQASNAKTRFLAAASHDLRQPMHALGLLTASLDRSEQVPPALAATVTQVRQIVASMDGLMNSLLDISRLDAGIVEAHPRAVALQDLFDRLGNEFGLLAERADLQLRVRPTDLVVHTDPVLFERILRNLLANALRYTSTGGVLLAARAHGASAVRVSVWDTGPGIPADRLGVIFEEFVRLETPRGAPGEGADLTSPQGQEQAKGLGLGLAIVDRLARLLGHRVEVMSRPGRGTCFSVELARLEDAEATHGAIDTPAISLAGCVVAFVEDDAPVRDATAALLREWGMTVVAGAECASVESALRAAGVRPAVIVSDYRLMGETGLEVIARLRTASKDIIPAVLVTADHVLPEQLAAMDRLVVAQKPLAPAALRVLIEDALLRPMAQ